ncbi:ABC transporter permease [Hespellia stercorisuis]|uniref:FtsX-like permease family protein n=1 Tax=Hespellia stercorisuis DSM 15480 TaxID=1121950 RepID=A0A1M6IAU6_9FIRM|nr:ABC transporter permease [Hespellia stercorisuis]SHJ31498.1 FtsX-like permease family protein [Hespellia stercorisuis DSM 15480]
MNNNISLGDKISYKIQDKDGGEVKLEVVGIHSDGDEFNGNAQGYAESMSQENLIFVPMGYLTSLASGDSINQISGRRKQFGILLSMGESKGSVIAQLLFELLIPFVISIPLGIIGTKVVLSKIPIPDLILQYIGSQPGFGSRDLIFALVMGVIMILCAVVMISIMIFTKSPKDLVRGRDAI